MRNQGESNPKNEKKEGRKGSTYPRMHAVLGLLVIFLGMKSERIEKHIQKLVRFACDGMVAKLG